MWGIRPQGGPLTRSARFIPTHVGNTLTLLTRGGPTTVHPHACGEYKKPISTPTIKGGSSPRMWGIRGWNREAENNDRFIPTHVGNTSRRQRVPSGSPVHPHACGEYGLVNGLLPYWVGSSPRMWGILELERQPMRVIRFIPTHVGNTENRVVGAVSWAVHPHACGEYQ